MLLVYVSLRLADRPLCDQIRVATRDLHAKVQLSARSWLVAPG
jgi:hypothetical protein